MTDPRFELVALDAIDRHPMNPRVGDVEALCETMATLGWWGVCIVQWRRGKRRTMLAGEHRWKALRKLCEEGWTDPEGRTWTYGELAGRVQLPPEGAMWCEVRRCNDEEALATVLADNRLPDRASYDEPALLEALRMQAASALGLLGTGWSADELKQLAAAQAWAGGDEKRDPWSDRVLRPVADAKIVRSGDVWDLGPHTLIVGDSRDPAVTARAAGSRMAAMVWTDPPYGIAYGGGGVAREQLEGDDQGPGVRALIVAAVGNALASSRSGATCWIASPGGEPIQHFIAAAVDLGVLRHTLVWVKNNATFCRSDYHYQHEILIYGWKPGGPHHANADRTLTTVWPFDRPRASELHPTMKPVELIGRCIEQHTAPSELILDPFAGSGSTLIAADHLGRVAGLVEIDPRYGEIICARFQDATGVKPTRDGELFDFGEAS